MFAGIYCQHAPAEVSLPNFAYGFSPLVEEVDERTVVIDTDGCELLFGSSYELAKAIATRAAQPAPAGLGQNVNVALTANPDAAIHAAKFCPGITFTSPGEELTTLGRLPLKHLQFALAGLEEDRTTEIFETLKLWGVSTFAQFAELPVAGVSERLGQDGLKLKQLAAGKTERHLRLRQPPPFFKSSVELEYPITELEPLSFILARLLNEVCASLNAYALATNSLRVELKLEKGMPHELHLNLPYAMRDHKVFLKLLLLETEAHPPAAPVTAVLIDCDPVKPRLLQSGLFVPLAPEPEKLELTLARLAKLLGADNIGSPELLDTHRPDAFRIKKFVLKSEGQRAKGKGRTAKGRQAAGSGRPKESTNPQSEIRRPPSIIGFRMFRPPLRAMVQAERGQPIEISAWDKQRSVYGKVVAAGGPWRTTGDWWRLDRWARDEWDVAVESARNHALYRIYRELSSGTWFVDGEYD